MTARSSRPNPPTPRPLSNWLIAVGSLVVLAIVAVIWFVLLRLYGGEGAQTQLDAIRTAGTLVIGTGGAVALLLTARRQRYTELSLVHTDRDATERRITELYAKAADQLGSERAPVRLAGLYALERLANSTVEHRQAIVEVICAYLRMPYTPPQLSASVPVRSYRSPGPTRRRRARTLTGRSPNITPTSRGARKEHAEQERQVRLTAQNILLQNLVVTAQRRRRWWHHPPPPAPAWPNIRLNLTGARLLDFSLLECQLDRADFTGAQFTGGANFRNAKFTGTASFEGVAFADTVDFVRAEFADRVSFDDARFADTADFAKAEFADRAAFVSAQFGGRAYFVGAEFTDRTYFMSAQFTGGVYFEDAQFTGEVHFEDAQFTGEVYFEDAQFTSSPNFEGARVDVANARGAVWPRGWRICSAEPGNQEDPAFRYLTRVAEDRPPDA